MIKTTPKKLALGADTLRALGHTDLRHVQGAGGDTYLCPTPPFTVTCSGGKGC